MSDDLNKNMEKEFREQVILLPVRDIVVYPYMILPLFVGRESSIQAVDEALNNNDRLIFLASQKDITVEKPTPEQIYDIGTLAMIMRTRKLPDGRVKILVQGLSKGRIEGFLQTDPYYKIKISKIPSVEYSQGDLAVEALIRNTKEQLEKIISLGRIISPDILMVLEDIQDPGRIADLIASNLGLKVEESQNILETIDPVERLHKVSQTLSKELEVLIMQAKIRSAAKDEISRTQKEYFLREQIKAIKNELGEDGGDKQDEFSELKEKIILAKMPLNVEKEALKQLGRLEKMHPDSSESSIIRTYLETMVDLPWAISSKEYLDLDRAKRVLDEDHFDLIKIKERILEHLAVKRLKGKDMKGPILCFTGPPGVGKTSLGKSIARATGREFIRISLGGVKDEAEIRGHRRTYVGAMPGRFIAALKQAGANNPVIMLDEVDKLGSDFRGDPSSALLEVLDPEQNHTFRDHYLNAPFDLSNIMFIATANVLENIPGPLQDRMEILPLTGYTHEEKSAIAIKYLIPKQMEENGITDQYVDISDEAIGSIISHYTREAGLRNLERKIASVCRKIARRIASNDLRKTHVDPELVAEFLGPHLYTREDEKEGDEIAVATGLAWTAVGGEVLYIEASMMRGKGLTLTGQLGDVMKESAHAAIGFIRSNAALLGIDDKIFEKNEIHVHIPTGATPKDGPSAGITIATTIVSLLTQKPINKHVAMTGEITLTGKVLPIGGLKEKALAAMRMGITKVVIPWKNKKDLVDIPEEYRQKLEFIPVKSVSEVLGIALVGWEPKVKTPKSTKPTGTTNKRKNKKLGVGLEKTKKTVEEKRKRKEKEGGMAA